MRAPFLGWRIEIAPDQGEFVWSQACLNPRFYCGVEGVGFSSARTTSLCRLWSGSSRLHAAFYVEDALLEPMLKDTSQAARDVA